MFLQRPSFLWFDCVIHPKEKLVTLDYTQLQLKQEERSLSHSQSGWQTSLL